MTTVLKLESNVTLVEKPVGGDLPWKTKVNMVFRSRHSKHKTTDTKLKKLLHYYFYFILNNTG